MKTAGLTGTPGCGKSTALKFFEDLGWVALDADAICTSLHDDPDSGIHEVMRQRWGTSVLRPDGTTDRKALAEIVFADEKELRWLESLLHPMVRRRAQLKLEECSCTGKVMLDTAILYECAWDSLVDCVITVWTDEKTQMERLLARNWTRKHAEERIATQWSASEKLERADYGIINNRSLDFLKEQCVRIDKLIQQKS